jgi:hypothetical protein
MTETCHGHKASADSQFTTTVALEGAGKRWKKALWVEYKKPLIWGVEYSPRETHSQGQEMGSKNSVPRRENSQENRCTIHHSTW